MTAHIGIVACSPPGAALCFDTICQLAAQRQENLEVSVHAQGFARYMRHVDREDWEGVANLMLSSAEKLATAGAELLVAPCNTIHAAFDWVKGRSPLPWLHIAEEVALEAKRQGIVRLGILGTKSTMESSIYAEKLSATGIDFTTPMVAERNEIDRIIFDELVKGVVTQAARKYFAMQVASLAGQGCDAIGLCCTELPLVLDEGNSTLPLLDSTRILAKAAVAKCLT